ncbi:MAG: phenylacetic acid degradation b [Bacteroidota bacterium]
MSALKSLDPRVARLNIPSEIELITEKEEQDQLNTYQVFRQMNLKRPFEHVGIVHAANLELAFTFAKEQYSRRQTCSGIWVVETEKVKTTDFTEDQESIYSKIEEPENKKGQMEEFDFFHLDKRGKQHVHIGSMKAENHEMALWRAKQELELDKPVYNVWVVKSEDLLKVEEGFQDIWDTLPDKRYREAVDYKAGDKLKEFKERMNQAK